MVFVNSMSDLMSEAWAQDIRARCEASGVPFFFKQWGGVRKERFGRELNGRTYDAMPERPNVRRMEAA